MPSTVVYKYICDECGCHEFNDFGVAPGGWTARYDEDWFQCGHCGEDEPDELRKPVRK